MNKTKEKIINTAQELYNSQGVNNVSIRQLAKESGISHSNLIYHFPDHESIILYLHDQMLQRAIKLNKEIDHPTVNLQDFFNGTKVGFSVVYEFRFLFNDLKYICSSFPRVKEVLVSVEQVRSRMYQTVIEQMINNGLMRAEEFENEFKNLITLIKILSDHWLTSSSIYDILSKEEKIEKYAFLLISFFYPYLTEKGKGEFLQITAPKPH
ncbi:MAG: TetR/AcrR family transcriptional regulator [Bacteroidia bacterium]